jgi:serine/threonine protein phosphatase PrpC
MLSDQEIYEIVRQKKSAKTLCEELASMANEAGGHDNITVVVFEHRAKGTAAESVEDASMPSEPNSNHER